MYHFVFVSVISSIILSFFKIKLS